MAGEVQRHVDSIGRNVFVATIKRRLPQGAMEELQFLVLNEKFIRRGMTMSYDLADAEYEASEGKIVPCILLHWSGGYTVKNISLEQASYPLQVNLPNPLHPALVDMLEIKSLQYRRGGAGHEFVECVEPDKVREFKQELLGSDPDNHPPIYCGSISLTPGESIEVTFNITIPKEDEDNEVFTVSGLTETLDVRVQDLAPGRRVLNARSIHRLPADELSAGSRDGVQHYRIASFLLPKQGITVWWKNKPEAKIE